MQEMKNIEEVSSQAKTGKPVAQAGNKTAIPTPRLMQELQHVKCTHTVQWP
jgi:hypothetical protein